MHQHYILTAMLGWMVFFHPFYISLTEAKYSESQGYFEISQKLFWDDFEVALGEEYGVKVNFIKPTDKKELESLIEEYLLKHNKLTVNGQDVKLNYLGYEVEEDASWFYFESDKVKNPKKVDVKNTVFLKQFDTQQHIINIYVSKKPKTLILDRKKSSGAVNFN